MLKFFIGDSNSCVIKNRIEFNDNNTHLLKLNDSLARG